MSGRKVFTAGEVLQAADVNDYLMDQSVMVFAGTAARGSAIPSPTEGMVTYRSDDDVVEVYNGSSFVPVGPGQILQVVSTTKTNNLTSTATTDTDIGLSATITPSSTSSKILILSHVSVGGGGDDAYPLSTLYRDATSLAVGDTAGVRGRASIANSLGVTTNYYVPALAHTYLDSPATTSAVVYSWKTRGQVSGRDWTVNISNANDATGASATSSITVMEIAG